MSNHRDNRDTEILAGSRAKFLFAPDELLFGLPIADQTAITEAVGHEVLVEGFDEYGHVELMFKDKDGVIHFVWVAPAAIEVVS